MFWNWKWIPKQLEFFNIFAIILFQLKEYQEAINGWQKAVSINKKYFHAYNNLANALLSLNNYEDAYKLK